MTTPATFHDGKTAAALDAIPRLEGEFLRVLTPEGNQITNWEQRHIALAHPSPLPLRLRLEPDGGERLTITDPTMAKAVQAWLSPSLTRTKQTTRNRWIASSALVWATAFLLWLASPLLLTLATELIPRSWEQQLGLQTKDTVARLLSGTISGGPIPWKSSGSGAEALQSLVSRLSAAGDNHGYTFDVRLLESSVLNAFAMPGGYIVVTTALVRQCKSPDQLAGVLAHEIGHVTERHATRGVIRQELLGFVTRLFTGGSDVIETLNKAGQALLNSRFTRDAEREADILAVRRLHNAGISPKAIGEFFALLPKEADNSGALSYLASHPPLADRQEYIANEAASLTGPISPALSPAEWQALENLSR